MTAPEDPGRAFVSLGSNIEPARHLPAAAGALAELGRELARSRIWRSPPADGSDQADYYNAALLLETTHPLDALLAGLAEIEDRLGRVRDPSDRYAPRTVDLDLSIVEGPGGALLRPPDPDIAIRVFVAVPLAELDPSWVHPVHGETLEGLAARLRAAEFPLSLAEDVGWGAARYGSP